MTVRFLLDPYHLSDAAAENLTDPARIPGLRGRIEDHLAGHQESVLIIRLSPSFFQRFADYEGLRGVEVHRLAPRPLLEQRLGCPPPPWLDREIWAVALCRQPVSPTPLVAPPDPHTDHGTWRVLAMRDPALVAPADAEAWLAALADLAGDFPGWLRLAPVQDVLAGPASAWLTPPHLTTLCEFLDAAPPPGGVESIREDIWWEPLRNLVTQAGNALITLALPPRRLPPQVLERLPLAPPRRSEELERMWRTVSEHVVSLIAQGTLNAAVLAELARAPWPSWWNWLTEQVNQTPDLATPELATVAQGHPAPAARALAERLLDSLRHAICPPWPAAVDAQGILAWCSEYLPYARGRLIAGREPESAVAEAFAQWILRETARIQRSGHDWREGGKAVAEALLDPEHLVVVIMMDALGMLDADLLLATLAETLQDARVRCRPLFAPQPTLTEIGKMAVLTGRPSASLPGDRGEALRRCYAIEEPALCLVKGFTPHPQQALSAATRLCVYLNDQVDDSLHQDDSYASHRERVRATVATLALQVVQIRGQAQRFGRRPVVFITADHGATAIDALLPRRG